MVAFGRDLTSSHDSMMEKALKQKTTTVFCFNHPVLFFGESSVM
jgi:hypothetical protein